MAVSYTHLAVVVKNSAYLIKYLYGMIPDFLWNQVHTLKPDIACLCDGLLII